MAKLDRKLYGLTYFWRAEHKQQIVFCLYFYVTCIFQYLHYPYIVKNVKDFNREL